MSDSVLQALGSDEEIVIRKRKKRIDGTFSAIGRISNTKTGVFTMDVFDLLDKVSKGAFHVFRELKFNRNEDNNTVHYPTVEWSKTKRETFSRQLKELRDVDLVRVVKKSIESYRPNITYQFERQTYIINPAFIKCWDSVEADWLWGSCKK